MINNNNSNIKVPLWTKNFILAFVSNLLMFFSFYLLVPVLPFFVINDLGATQSVAGVVLSLYTLAALFVRPFSGYMVDSFARKPLHFIFYAIFSAVFAGYIVTSVMMVFIILRIVHGMAFGISSVSGNTLAIDVMPAERRGEGIGYFGMSSNIAMAMGPMAGLMIYQALSFNAAFLTSLAASLLGLCTVAMIKVPKRVLPTIKEVVSLDRFILLKGMHGAVVLFTIGIGYGIIITYIGIYNEELNLGGSAGLFFTLQAVGIISARVLSTKYINGGLIARAVYFGSSFLICGYTLFILHTSLATFYTAALLLGLGFGYITPAFQTMFINLAEHNRRGTANSTYLTSWDIGIGLGIALGGVLSKLFGFDLLFAICGISVALGMVYFKRIAAPYFIKNRLR